MSTRYFPIGAMGSSSVEAHLHTPEEVQEMVTLARHEPPTPLNYVLFLDSAYDALRQNAGHAGFAIVPAHNGAHSTFVIYSVDKNGHFITGPDAVVIENGQNCPPECAAPLPL